MHAGRTSPTGILFVAVALLASPWAEAARGPVDVTGRRGELSGKEILRVKKLGRTKSKRAASLSLGVGTYQEVREGSITLAGTFTPQGKKGRKLLVTDDAASAAALADHLAALTAALYETKRGRPTEIVVTILETKAKAKVNRKASRIALKRRITFEASAVAEGETWTAKYTAKLRGRLVDPSANDPIAQSLASLGVDTTATPRLDDDEAAIDETYTPFGSTLALGATAELYVLGLPLGSDPSAASLIGVVPDPPPPGELPTSWTAGPLVAPPPAETPWAVLSPNDGVPAALRSATAGDVDGDGLGEVVVAYFEGQDLKLHVLDDAEDAFATTAVSLGTFPDVLDLAAIAVDVDGDGVTEIALALARPDEVELRIVGRQSETFAIIRTVPVATRSLVGSQLFTSLAAGNVDRDRGEEIAVVVNEGYGVFASETGAARAVLLDDAGADYTTLHDAVVRGEVGLQVYTAVVADPALGDIDGDGMDELILGGLTNVYSGGGCTSYGHVLVALDDVRHDLVPLGAHYFDHFLQNCPDFNAWRLRYLHVNTLDLDRDGVEEIQANWFVYDDFRDEPPWTEIHQLPLDEFFPFPGNRIDRSTSWMATGDVTGDGGEDVILLAQDAGEVSVWSDDPVTGWGKVTHQGGPLLSVVPENSQDPVSPVVVPVNATNDGPVLRFVSGEHHLVFTEPVVIAALASPPCGVNIGQVTGDCRTQYGTAVSDTVTAESTFTVSAGFHFGVKGGVSVFGVDVLEAEAKTTITGRASVFASAAYTLEKTVVFTSGPLEDAVVFTTVPYDQYTFMVVSDPNPDLIGTEFILSIPREPITLLAERTFFNDNVPPGGPVIGANVFAHTVGEIRSYPTAAEKTALLSQYSYPPLPLLFQTSAQSVGQGSGNTMVSLVFEELYTAGAGYEIEYTFETSVTGGGVMAGYEIGTSIGASLAYSKGEKTLYAGTVGNIDAANFPDNLYSFGLFTYALPDPASGQTFEVVNYWVQ